MYAGQMNAGGVGAGGHWSGQQQQQVPVGQAGPTGSMGYPALLTNPAQSSYGPGVVPGNSAWQAGYGPGGLQQQPQQGYDPAWQGGGLATPRYTQQQQQQQQQGFGGVNQLEYPRPVSVQGGGHLGSGSVVEGGGYRSGDRAQLLADTLSAAQVLLHDEHSRDAFNGCLSLLQQLSGAQ
jgi:hypothetical protein